MSHFDTANQTYTLDYTGMGHTGWEIADWTDTVLHAAAAVRRGDRARLDDRAWLAEALGASRRLAEALAALDDELLLAARDASPAVPLRELAKVLERHHSSVDERLRKISAGKVALRRGWLLGLPFDHAEADSEGDEPTRR